MLCYKVHKVTLSLLLPMQHTAEVFIYNCFQSILSLFYDAVVLPMICSYTMSTRFATFSPQRFIMHPTHNWHFIMYYYLLFACHNVLAPQSQLYHSEEIYSCVIFLVSGYDGSFEFVFIILCIVNFWCSGSIMLRGTWAYPGFSIPVEDQFMPDYRSTGLPSIQCLMMLLCLYFFPPPVYSQS